jgi:thiosulfate dehydrogenase (quinone) large subunit
VNKANYIWGTLRIVMGWTFLWPFLDKVWGLGFATEPGKGWIDGSSPTLGFLKFGTKGPFASFYQSLAGHPVIDCLFMVGLLLIGLALILGIGVKIAGFSGALLLLLMYTAGFIPPEHNPFIDEHLINAIVLIGLAVSNAGNYFGFGRAWGNTRLVQKFSVLK